MILLDLFHSGEQGCRCRERAMRKRIKQTETLEERLQKFADQSREAARAMPPGKDRTELLRKARQAETTAHINEWVTSPGLQPPKQP
jgi:hypothetical protein